MNFSSTTLTYNASPYGNAIDMLVEQLATAQAKRQAIFDVWEAAGDKPLAEKDWLACEKFDADADEISDYIDSILDDLEALGW